MTRDHGCSWTGTEWVTPEHLRDCNSHHCDGCKPCPESHCALRGKCNNHLNAGELTCPRCIGNVRKDLSAIVHRYTELADEAIEQGINSEAFNLNGPAASVDQVAARRAFGHLVDPDDQHHPYAVLGRWDMVLRDSYSQPTDLLVSIGRAKDYLDRQLDRLANDPNHDFEEFATDIRKCLNHLEQVLHDSRSPELGAPCPRCALERDKAPRLAKKWGREEIEDRWICRDCDLILTEAEYRLRIGTEYRKNAAYLTASDIHDEYGIKASTVRTWAARGLIAKRGKNSDGQQLYDVGQTIERHAEQTFDHANTRSTMV